MFIGHPNLEWGINVYSNDHVLNKEIAKIFCGFVISENEELVYKNRINVWIEKSDFELLVNIENLEVQKFNDRNLLIQWLYEMCFHHTCLESAGWIFLHGAAVKNKENKVVLLLGKTHAGKSTLTATLCLTDRYKYMSDDIVPICMSSSNLEATSFPKAIMIRDMNILPSSAYAYECGKLEYPDGKIATLLDMYEDNTDVSEQGQIAAIFFLNRLSDHALCTRRYLNNEEKFRQVFECIRNPNRGKQNFEVINKLMKHEKCFALDYNDCQDAVAIIDSVLFE